MTTMIKPNCTTCFNSGVDLFLGPNGEVNACPDCAPTELKTLCTRCQTTLVLHWPAIVEFGGNRMPAAEALAASLRNPNCYICCDKCISEMPDANLEDLKTDP